MESNLHFIMEPAWSSVHCAMFHVLFNATPFGHQFHCVGGHNIFWRIISFDYKSSCRSQFRTT